MDGFFIQGYTFEKEIITKLTILPVPEREWKLIWWCDQKLKIREFLLISGLLK